MSYRIKHVNKVMQEINNCTDEIYEGLADGNMEEVDAAAEKLILILKSITNQI